MAEEGMAENKRTFTIKTSQLRSFWESKHTFAFKTIPNECGITRAVV